MSSPPAPTLDVRDLRLVLALIDEGTTARAARALHLAQPSVSRALLALEARLETPLFRRTPRGLVPTPAGERLAAEAPAVLEGLIAVERRLREPAPARRRVRVVCECYTAYHWVPGALRALREELPEADLAVRLEHTQDAWTALADGDVDVALLTGARDTTDEVIVRPLFKDELVFLLGRGHALARAPHLTPDDLKASPLYASRPAENEARWFLRSVFGRGRPRLDVTYVPVTEAIVELARAGLGIGLLTEWVVAPYLARPGLVSRRLATGPLERPWFLGWRAELGALGPRLHRALRSLAPTP